MADVSPEIPMTGRRARLSLKHSYAADIRHVRQKKVPMGPLTDENQVHKKLRSRDLEPVILPFQLF